MIYTAHEQIGYRCYDKKVFVNRKLRYMPYAQAGWIDIEQKDGTTSSEFYSYSSKIFTVLRAVVDGRQVLEGISTKDNNAYSNCSRTTSRQCIAALREIGLSEKDVRSIKHYFDKGGGFALLYRYSNGGEQWCDAFTGEVIS